MSEHPISVLLVGPYDPHCGEYTFLAPPLGVWRLKGVLQAAGITTEVFDPNCCDGAPEDAFQERLARRSWSAIGISTTGMTLRYDLALAHQARRAQPHAVMVAGGMEATFKPELMFELGPFDLVVLGEGEKPMLEIAHRLSAAAALDGIPGTARRGPDGKSTRHFQIALDPNELRDAIFATPYDEMPYDRYWSHLERAYRVGELPMKADREARLDEIRSVRLITLNYCPMACTFCSSTNFLHAAQGGTARIRRLDATECLTMIKRILVAHPGVRTIIFQDDIFVFTNDDRIMPLCDGIVHAKRNAEIPEGLQFISTNRIDAMTTERLAAMRRAGFRVLGFGIESFSASILKEFNKGRIFTYIDPNLGSALRLGITPFLDLILTSPRSSMRDLSDSICSAYNWLLAGCEMGMYPYIIPFSGAAMASDPKLEPYTRYTEQQIAGTDISWQQPTKILPIDPEVRSAILAIEEEYTWWLELLQSRIAHLPSRVRSLIWILSASSYLEAAGQRTPRRANVVAHLIERLPGLTAEERRLLYDGATVQLASGESFAGSLHS